MNSIIATFHYNLYTHLYFYFWVFVFGAIVGSFLNVVVFRLFSGESIVLPPSHCNICNSKIRWYDNIPIFSYFILLQGKCRDCHAKISIQYPIVEFLCALLFLLIFIRYEFSLQTVFLMYFGAASLVMCVTDFKEQVIFDVVSIPLIPIGLIYSCFNIANQEIINISFFSFSIPQNILSSILGIIAGFLFFETVSLISNLLIKQRAFGEGDTVIAMGIGAWFGLNSLIITIIFSLILQAICVFPLMLFRFYKNNDKSSIFNFLMLFASLFILILANILGLMKVWLFSIIISILVMISALFFVIKILNKLRENEFPPMMFPFGPALIISIFLVVSFPNLFFDVLNFYLKIIG